MPRPPKAQYARQNRERRDLGVIQGGALAPTEPPRAPSGLLKPERESWERFWNSELGQSPAIRRDTDIEVIRRLWTLYDLRHRAHRSFKKDPMIIGSQGQKVLNPMGRQMSDLDSKIVQLEDRIGLSPMARLKLGITFGEAHRSLEALNKEFNRDDGDDAGDDDPRIIEVKAKSG